MKWNRLLSPIANPDYTEDEFVLRKIQLLQIYPCCSGSLQGLSGEGEDIAPMQLAINYDDIEPWKRRTERVRDIGHPTARP